MPVPDQRRAALRLEAKPIRLDDVVEQALERGRRWSE